MCGRYFFDLESATDEERTVIEEMLEKGNLKPSGPGRFEHSPGMRNEVYVAVNGEFVRREMLWGFPGAAGKQGMINARCETAFSLPTFADSAQFRRCVVKVPGGGYYEWNKKDPMRPRFAVRVKGMKDLYMAGLYTQIDPALGCARYVIVTQPANDAVAPVHHRMPLIFTRKADIANWLLDTRAAQAIAASPPTVDLDIATDDPQQVRLF